MVELCTKNLQIMRNDFTDYALTFGQLCANYEHFLPIMRRLCATILKIRRALFANDLCHFLPKTFLGFVLHIAE